MQDTLYLVITFPRVPLGRDHFSNFPSFEGLDSFEEYYWRGIL